MKMLISIIEELDLCDIWKARHSDDKHYSLIRYNPTPSSSRINYFLLSNSLNQLVDNCNYSPGINSDPSFVELSLSKFDMIRGPGFWKFNTTLLEKPECVFKIQNLLEKAGAKYAECTVDTRRELIKCDIISATQDTGGMASDSF